jgi:hypothetical protein
VIVWFACPLISAVYEPGGWMFPEPPLPSQTTNDEPAELVSVRTVVLPCLIVAVHDGMAFASLLVA